MKDIFNKSIIFLLLIVIGFIALPVLAMGNHLAPKSQLQEVKKGVDAASKGDYLKAFTMWRIRVTNVLLKLLSNLWGNVWRSIPLTEDEITSYGSLITRDILPILFIDGVFDPSNDNGTDPLANKISEIENALNGKIIKFDLDEVYSRLTTANAHWKSRMRKFSGEEWQRYGIIYGSLKSLMSKVEQEGSPEKKKQFLANAILGYFASNRGNLYSLRDLYYRQYDQWRNDHTFLEIRKPEIKPKFVGDRMKVLKYGDQVKGFKLDQTDMAALMYYFRHDKWLTYLEQTLYAERILAAYPFTEDPRKQIRELLFEGRGVKLFHLPNKK